MEHHIKMAHSKRRWSVIARAPVRFDFTAGYTDVEELFQRRRGLAVNAAINLFTSVRLTVEDRSDLSVISPLGRFSIAKGCSIPDDHPMALVGAAIRRFRCGSGLIVRIASEAPVASGLGTSAALGVALVAALAELVGARMSRAEIAMAAADLERSIGHLGGMQDQFASAFGGINRLEFRSSQPRVTPLPRLAAFRASLESHLLLVHPGGARNSGDLVAEVLERHAKRTRETDAVLRDMNALANKIWDCLARRNLLSFGQCLARAGRLQAMIHPRILCSRAKRLLRYASRFSANGKLTGGGGPGSCLLFLCKPESRRSLERALTLAGARPLSLRLSLRGVRVNTALGSDVNDHPPLRSTGVSRTSWS